MAVIATATAAATATTTTTKHELASQTSQLFT